MKFLANENVAGDAVIGDQLGYELYGLMEEEIKIVAGRQCKNEILCGKMFVPWRQGGIGYVRENNIRP